jgi:L-threonylcarbamoyladenylate synthase
VKIINASEKNSIELACEFLKAGKIISFATDTVYGLAVDAANDKAVENLFKIKNRDEKKPIAIFVKDLATAKKIFIFDELSKKIAKKFLPGSLTLVLKTNSQNSQKLSSHLNQNNDNFLGFRIVDNQFVKNLLQKFGGILAVTSANPSNQKPAISADEVAKYFTKSNLDLLIDSGKSKWQEPSTVAKIADGEITILRQGTLKIT